MDLKTKVMIKWIADFSGVTPTLDADSVVEEYDGGVNIGDEAFCSSSLKQWKCTDNTAGSPVWIELKTATDGVDGIDGDDGASSFVYLAYASDDSGADFTTTFSASLDYIAIKATTTEITSPVASDFTGLWKKYKGDDGEDASTSEVISIACSDETTDLEVGTGLVTFRMPYAMTLTGVRASVTTAATGAALTVDINEGGSSILSTKLTIDDGEKTSTTATTAAVISDTALADDVEITIDVDQIGSTIAGAGLKVTLIGTRT